MAHTQRHPQYTQSFIDSCAFNPGGIEEAASRRILEKWPNIIVAHSVQKELEHPNTPDDVKRLSKEFVYTIERELTPELLKMKDEIRILVKGNAKPGKHKGDADHLFELYKFGGGYFVTTDMRLLSLSDELSKNYYYPLIHSRFIWERNSRLRHLHFYNLYRLTNSLSKGSLTALLKIIKQISFILQKLMI